MKTLKITPPEGCEVDKDKSTFEEIVFKKIEKPAKTWEEIQELNISNRVTQYCFDLYGEIEEFKLDNSYNLDQLISHVPDKRTAKKIRAQCQMYVIAKHYNGDWKPNWNNLFESKFIPLWNNSTEKIYIVSWTITSYCSPIFKSMDSILEAYENNKLIFETALKP